MEYLVYEDKYKKMIYDLFIDFQREDKFYKELTFEEFDNLVFKNSNYANEGSFLCVENNTVIAYIGSLVRKSDEGNPNSSGYIHTLIVKKEYRRQGIGSKLLNMAEEYIRSKNKKSVRIVFLQGINYPWIIPHTNNHLHPGCPGVIINSEYYIFLYHHKYFVNSIHEGFHLNLCDYLLPKSVESKIKENEKNNIKIELYDPNVHYGIDEFCLEINNDGFANAIKSNLKREKPYPFIVASDNGKVVGWTGAIYTEESGRGHLDGICVSPSYYRLGLGSGIFSKLCLESKKNNAKYMTFFTGLDNPARYIYLKAGFNVVCSFADMKKNLE